MPQFVHRVGASPRKRSVQCPSHLSASLSAGDDSLAQCAPVIWHSAFSGSADEPAIPICLLFGDVSPRYLRAGRDSPGHRTAIMHHGHPPMITARGQCGPLRSNSYISRQTLLYWVGGWDYLANGQSFTIASNFIIKHQNYTSPSCGCRTTPADIVGRK